MSVLQSNLCAKVYVDNILNIDGEKQALAFELALHPIICVISCPSRRVDFSDVVEYCFRFANEEHSLGCHHNNAVREGWKQVCSFSVANRLPRLFESYFGEFYRFVTRENFLFTRRVGYGR